MQIQEGYVYHIKNEYFRRARDSHLMQNKEHGYRPALLCFQDKDSGLLWFVPMSSKVEKYRTKQRLAKQRYGNCITIEIGSYGGKEAAFLLQNLFPVRPEDIDHIHTLEGQARPVRYGIFKKVRSNFKRIREITKHGKKITFTNIRRLEEQLLLEMQAEENHKESEKSEATKEKQSSLDDKITAARLQQRNQLCIQLQKGRGPPQEPEHERTEP